MYSPSKRNAFHFFSPALKHTYPSQYKALYLTRKIIIMQTSKNFCLLIFGIVKILMNIIRIKIAHPVGKAVL